MKDLLNKIKSSNVTIYAVAFGFIGLLSVVFIRAAAPFVAIEPETAILASGATAGTDASASGGQYAQFGGGTTTSFQPTEPYYATFFYLWHKNVISDGGWSYWQDSGNNPPVSWFSKYLPDPNPAVFDPANELYSNNSYETFKWQATKLAEAKQEVAIGSWFGQGTKQDVSLDNILNDFMARPDNPYPNLRWAVYYEDEGFADPSVSTLVNDLDHISTKFTSSPYYFRINGKPVIFVYGGVDGGSSGPCGNASDTSMTNRWWMAKNQAQEQYYVVLKLFGGYASDACQPDSWHQYAPANRSGVHAPYSSFVSPGFFLDDGVSTERLPRDLGAFQAAVTSMVQDNVTWKLVETWNEWGEGSSVEPGNPTKIDASGNEILDPAGVPFENLYIDVLSSTLPPLESGTGL